MNFTLKRRQFRKDGIFGELLDHNGIFFSHTLEHAYPNEDGSFIPKIPAGKYTCVRFESPHLGYEVFMLKDVPGHDHILIHILNYNEESNGCIGVGTGLGRRLNGDFMLTNSGGVNGAFAKLMNVQKEIDSFFLTVCD